MKPFVTSIIAGLALFQGAQAGLDLSASNNVAVYWGMLDYSSSIGVKLTSNFSRPKLLWVWLGKPGPAEAVLLLR